MGLYDRLHCHVPLPFPEGVSDALRASLQASEYQTKDLVCFMRDYEIREDGSFWREEYDIEDRSDPNAEGLLCIAGCLTRVNKRWKADTKTFARISFYTNIGKECTGFVEFQADIVDGRLYRDIKLVEYRPEDPVEEISRAEYRKEWIKKMVEET